MRGHYSNILVRTNLCATVAISGKYLMVGLNFSCMSHKKKKERLAASLPIERVARAAIPETFVTLSVQKEHSVNFQRPTKVQPFVASTRRQAGKLSAPSVFKQ